MACAGQPLPAGIEHLGRLEPHERDHSAQVEVHLLILRERVEDTCGEQPVVGVVVHRLNAHCGLQAVEALRRETLEESVGRTIVAHAVDHVRALRVLVHHLGHGVDVVLSVAVDRDGHVAAEVARLHQSGPQGLLVPAVAALPNADETRIVCRELGDDLPGAVRAAVIDEQDAAFVRDPAGGHEGRQLVREQRTRDGERCLLVVTRYDDNQFRCLR